MTPTKSPFDWTRPFRLVAAQDAFAFVASLRLSTALEQLGDGADSWCNAAMNGSALRFMDAVRKQGAKWNADPHIQPGVATITFSWEDHLLGIWVYETFSFESPKVIGIDGVPRLTFRVLWHTAEETPEKPHLSIRFGEFDFLNPLYFCH